MDYLSFRWFFHKGIILPFETSLEKKTWPKEWGQEESDEISSLKMKFRGGG